MPLSSKKIRTGFTIVELLIVIVVIGILAAITIVAYNGIQNRGKTTASKSAATSVQKKIESYASIKGIYPTANLTTELNSLNESSLSGTGITIAGPYPTVMPTATTGTTAIKVDTCHSPSNTGYRVYYWDYDAPNQTGQYGAVTLAYGGTIGANGAGCSAWASAQ